MIIDVYRLRCLTNLHMGSGDSNYNVIDLEVERDPVLGEPIMNATGVKGSLRDYFEEHMDEEHMDKDDVNRIFGAPAPNTTAGTFKFFDADMIARPVRVSKGDRAYALATSWDIIEHLYRKLAAFDAAGFLPEKPEWTDKTVARGSGTVEAVEEINIRKTESETELAFMKKLVGSDNWVLMNENQLHGISLPIQAHNVLDESRKSKNLWYEESVPHESLFCLMIARPDDEKALSLDGALIQFGAGASTGCGYVKLEKLNKESGNEQTAN